MRVTELKYGGLRLATGALGLILAGPAIANDAKKVAYGRHLSGECSACHRIDGTDNGIPSIAGWDPEEFVHTLVFYRNGERNNPAMVSVAQSLDDDQMNALAAYYGSLPKAAPAKKK
jgi:cytochrome c553